MKTLTRRSALLAAALGGAVMFLGACGDRSVLYNNSAGSLALSRDDAFLYAVDSDNDVVSVVDTASNALVTQVHVGRAPERIVVGSDDTIYVSNRGSRSVSVIKRGAGNWSEILQLPVGVEPMGLAVSPDNQTLYVVNSTSLETPEVGTLTAIDVKTLQTRWDLAVGQEPRGITLVAGGRALVTLFKGGDVVTVDLNGPSVLQTGTDLYQKGNASSLDARTSGQFPELSGGFRTFHPRAMSDAVVTPDGKRAIVSMVWSREDSLASPGGGGGGGASYGGGPCGAGGVATAGLATFDATGEQTVAMSDDVNHCGDGDVSKDFPASTLTSPDSSQSLQGPTVAAMDGTGSWLFVVNRLSNNVAVLPVGNRMGSTPSGSGTNTFDGPFFQPGPIRSLVPVGAGPNGIALTRDGRKAFVYNAFDHSISTLVQTGSGDTAEVTTSGRALVVAQDVLPADVVAGRRLFFSAADSRMTASTTGVACATCHLDGREDGHVWVFADGPRQTPSLAGRMTTATAPFHWNGQFNTLTDFLAETVNNRMGGTGASSQMATQLAAFIDSQALPENPLRTGSPTQAQLRGAQAFQKAECNTCHAGATLTDNTFHDVGTMVLGGANPDMGLDRGLNVPSLLGVSRSAPYLHDGSAASLRQRLLASRTSDLHGKTTLLSDGEIDDLVEYLNTL